MVLPWSYAFYVMKVVWIIMNGWVSSCLIVADEIARSIRTGEIGPFHIG
ncbi:uncharacterized protein [Aristolochia californica]